MLVVFCKQKTVYEMGISDWSSDVCSSDLIKLVVRRENALVEHLPGGFQQGGPRPLQDHLPLLRKGRGQRSFARPAGQRQIRHRLRQGAMRKQCRATQTRSREQAAAGQPGERMCRSGHIGAPSLVAWATIWLGSEIKLTCETDDFDQVS